MINRIKYIALLFVIMQLPTYAQVQEVYSKQYYLRDKFSSDRTKVLKEDKIITVSSLTTPITGVPAIKTDIKTAFLTIQVLKLKSSTSITNDGTKITIPKGATVEETYITPLLKVTPIKFSAMSDQQKDSIRRVYPINSVVKYTVERKLPTGKVTAEESLVVTEDFIQERTISKVIVVTEAPTERGYVKFDEDKVWINPNLLSSADQGLHYYQLKNRFTISLWTTDVSVSALTMPVKYRFKGKRDNGKSFSEDFASAVNVNVFAGPSFGKTSFHYREKVGNVSNTWKVTGGLIVGGSTVTLNKSNTTAADTPILDTTEITKGLLSLGVGAAYSYNKATIGLFLGRDYSVGKDASRWDYNRKPWLGVAIGYSVFSI